MNVDEKSSKGDKTPNATQNAMRFLKRNFAATEGNEDKNPSAKEKRGPHENVYAGNSTPYDFRRPRGFDQMVSDRLGEELAPDAAIWNIYLDEAQDQDRELVDGRQRSLDTLLLFAALFSAILTAFLIESKNLLQQDPADASAALLLIIAQSQQRMELGLPTPEESTNPVAMPDFTPSLSARWINGIWFMSLGLSLSAALIAMLGKEWLITFQSSRPRSTRRLAFIRQSRLKGLEDWGALHIIALLPTLLHVSLLLFSVGLVIYLWALDVAVAAVLSAVISATLSFYLVTGILGAVYEFCPFVTEISEYTRKAVAAIFRPPTKDSNNEALGASIKDLQAMAWLSKHSVDPIVVDYAYQAMAGLHRSPYIYLETPRPVLDLHLNPVLSDKSSTIDKDTTIESLYLDVSGRFEELLVGTLETGSSDPPVCRYINAMIALGSCLGSSKNANLTNCIDLLDKINRFWRSSFPQASMSGSNFAGVLIAEVDVIKLTADALGLGTAESDNPLEKGTDVDLGLREPDTLISVNQNQHVIEVQSPATKMDGSTSDLLQRLNTRMTEWINISLTLLQSHAKGETAIDSYLLNGLLRAVRDGAHNLELTYQVLYSQNPNYAVPRPKNQLDSLKILIFLLSQPANSNLGSVPQLTEILKAFSYIAPVTLQQLERSDRNNLGHALRMCMGNTGPLTTRREILFITTRYMLLLSKHLCNLMPDPECLEIVADALSLEYNCTNEDHNADEGPRAAVRHHIGDYINILEFFGEKESNVRLMKPKSKSLLCLITLLPLSQHIPANGLYIPPSCVLTLVRLLAHTDLTSNAVHSHLNLVLTRLRSPNVSISQLPAQSSPFPEPRPSIEYLHQFTHLSGGFSALVQAGSMGDGYPSAVVPGIASITIIAANYDPALKVEPVELKPPAVPGFLEALSWTLPPLSSLDDKNLYHRFILAASVLLVVACKDPESRDEIVVHQGRTKLREELRDHKDVYAGLVSEEEWKRLVEGLALDESGEEGTERDSTSDKDGLSEGGERSDEDEVSSGHENVVDETNLETGVEDSEVNATVTQD
ncbi:unnamed protein product [Rhizoctonia solani]|uniref:DUF6535 domain-containing protein n=1 Tax=Rhizoctonia solani TaxID=456999 RepID=A0A8H3BJC2_9AGAM|nr:unnamed protein product [Rhizoctonia solani]